MSDNVTNMLVTLSLILLTVLLLILYIVYMYYIVKILYLYVKIGCNKILYVPILFFLLFFCQRMN
jgi:hypothetical protein